MNQVFGYQVMTDEIPSDDVVFTGTKPVLVDAKIGQVKIFTELNTHLQSYHSIKYGAYLYLWGIPAHPEMAPSEIPEWCVNVIAEKRYRRFRAATSGLFRVQA